MKPPRSRPTGVQGPGLHRNHLREPWPWFPFTPGTEGSAPGAQRQETNMAPLAPRHGHPQGLRVSMLALEQGLVKGIWARESRRHSVSGAQTNRCRPCRIEATPVPRAPSALAVPLSASGSPSAPHSRLRPSESGACLPTAVRGPLFRMFPEHYVTCDRAATSERGSGHRGQEPRPSPGAGATGQDYREQLPGRASWETGVFLDFENK